MKDNPTRIEGFKSRVIGFKRPSIPIEFGGIIVKNTIGSSFSVSIEIEVSSDGSPLELSGKKFMMYLKGLKSSRISAFFDEFGESKHLDRERSGLWINARPGQLGCPSKLNSFK